MEQKNYTAKDYIPGEMAFAVKQNKEVEIISALQKDDIILVKVKGFDTDNPDKVVSIAHAVNGQLYLKPINGEDNGAASDADFLDVETKTVVEDVEVEEADVVVEETKPTETEPTEADSHSVIEEVPEDALTDGSPEDTAHGETEEELRKTWLSLGLDDASFNRTLEQEDGLRLITEITGRLDTAVTTASSKTQTGEVDWTKVKLRKFWEAGKLISFSDFLKQNELAENQADDLLETLRLIGNAFQYSTGAFRVKTQEINTNARTGYTEALRRIIANYRAMVQFGLVDDVFDVSFKQPEE